MCGRNNRTAIDHQITIGVNAVTFRAQACNDADGTAVNGGDGNVVLIGIDAIVAAADIQSAAVDGQMQLRIQAFVFSIQVQHTGTIHIHGHIGVDGAILLPQLLFTVSILIDTGNIGTGNFVFAFQNQVRAGITGIHFCLGGILTPESVALIGVQEQNGGSDGAGNVRIVQNQFHHCVLIFVSIVAQIHTDLTGAQFAGNAVSTGFGDIDNRVRRCFIGGVLVRIGTLAVRIAAFVGILILVINNIVACINALRVGLDTLIGKLDQGFRRKTAFVRNLHNHRFCRNSNFHCLGFLRCGRRFGLCAATGEHQQRQQQCDQSFHNRTSLVFCIIPYAT